MCRKFRPMAVGLGIALLIWATPILGQIKSVNEQEARGNKPERLAWFMGLGFGMMHNLGVDTPLGCEGSHSLVGADEDYCRRFFKELPKTLSLRHYSPEDWADMIKVAGVKYVVFVAKHHSGFCMWDTATTPFKITNTPYGKDAVAEALPVLRRRGIAVGLLFSPEDFWLLHQQGVTISRKGQGVRPSENPGLMEHNLAQVRELLTKYGPLDMIFFDGQANRLRELCWQLQPDIVVTRGAIKTPEQHIPGVRFDQPWETCMTMGTQWQYKPTNEKYKSGTGLIERLIEIRAKGGNYLLSIGFQPDGIIPLEQERRLQEVGLWSFINGEAIYDVEPWIVTHEDKIWFTKRRGENTVYAILTRPNWSHDARREIILRSVKAGKNTTVGILGQSGKVMEYWPDLDPGTKWKQTEDGLKISAMRAQRIYCDHTWPNAVVLRITDAHPAVSSPDVPKPSAKSAANSKAK